MITGIILASGFSKRMKKDKLLISLGGQTIIEYVINAAVNSNLDRIILVYRKEDVKKIAQKYQIETLYNNNSHLGQSQAMKLGIEATNDETSFMFIMGDQPFITTSLINKLISEYKNTELPISVPFYNGNRGMPIIISNEYRDKLLKVEGDKGGRDIISKNHNKVHRVYMDDIKLGIDIDTPEDLEKVKRWI